MKLKPYTSKDLWLVLLLIGAAFTATVYFFLSPGSIAENLGLVQPIQTTQMAQVVSGSTVTVSNLSELTSAISAATNGETIELKPAVYDWFKVSQYTYNPQNTDYVTITSADPNDRAVMVGLEIDSPYFIFKDLSFRIPPGKTGLSISTHDIKVLGCDFASADAVNAPHWKANDWNTKTGMAISIYPNTTNKNFEIAYNNVRYVNFGIVMAAGTYFHDNFLQHLAGDETRIWGPNSVYENNYVADNYQVNANHNDMLQSGIWGSGASPTMVLGATIKNNSFIAHDAAADSMYVASTTDTQGLFLGDGPYDNWDVENNLVISSVWQGLGFDGPQNTIVKYNLEADANPTDQYGPPWISVGTNSGPVVNTTVSDNYAPSYTLDSAVTASNNTTIILADYPTYFKDYQHYDWTINPGSLPFSVGATLDMTKVAPTPYQNVVTPMDNTTVVPTTNNTVGGVVTSGSYTSTPSSPTPAPTTPTTPTSAPAPSTGGGGGFSTGVPTLDLTLTPTTTDFTHSARLTWYSTKAYRCTASGSWVGNQSLSSSIGIIKTATGTYPYTLTCDGTGGTVTKTVTLTVASTPETITPTTPTSPASWLSRFPAGTAVYTTDKLNVRATPGGQRLGAQSKSAGGTVTSQTPVASGGYVWIKVDFQGTLDGWVADSYLSGQTPTQSYVVPTPTPLGIGRHIVTTNYVHVRSFAGLTAKTYSTRKPGDSGTIISGPITANGYAWWNVNFDAGTDGWVAGEFLRGL